VELKVAGKRIADVLNRMHVAQPKNRCGGWGGPAPGAARRLLLLVLLG
jgi:hypothetical protein